MCCHGNLSLPGGKHHLQWFMDKLLHCEKGIICLYIRDFALSEPKVKRSPPPLALITAAVQVLQIWYLHTCVCMYIRIQYIMIYYVYTLLWLGWSTEWPRCAEKGVSDSQTRVTKPWDANEKLISWQMQYVWIHIYIYVYL